VRLARPAIVVSAGLALGSWLAGKRLLGLPDAAWAACFGALLILTVAAAERRWLSRLGHSRPLQFFGKYSYAMYVFQLPLIPAVAFLVTAPGLASSLGSAWLGQAAYCAILFCLTTLVAVASWHLFEKHFLALKHRFGG
jgi:peptidoglycan/LPS O-acetylase OafA/YrhL